MLEDALYNLLSNDSGVSNLVGTRIYPVLADEQEVEPYLVYQVVSAPRTNTLQAPMDVVQARVQVTCWATSYYGAVQLKEAVRACLSGYRGTEATSQTVIEYIAMEDEGDIIDFSAGQDKTKSYGKRIDFYVSFKE
jgi:hypothetical protein